MSRISVTSSNLKSVGYTDGTLEIEFFGGRIYQYADVPQGIYEELMRANSHGKYFHRRIRNSYRYQRIV
jgi:hypothetical protein